MIILKIPKFTSIYKHKFISLNNITGDFKDAEVYVFNNNLTRFEESVFGPILQQMTSRNGFISAQYDSGSRLCN